MPKISCESPHIIESPVIFSAIFGFGSRLLVGGKPNSEGFHDLNLEIEHSCHMEDHIKMAAQ